MQMEIFIVIFAKSVNWLHGDESHKINSEKKDITTPSIAKAREASKSFPMTLEIFTPNILLRGSGYLVSG